MKFLICLLIVFFAFPAMAQDSDIFNKSGQTIPRFVSIKSDKVFVRAGPGVRYPIKWVFKKDGYPVEVVQEFDTWRKIKDHEGEEGWIHQTLLSGKRRGIVIQEKGAFMLKKPLDEATQIAFIENKVVVDIIQCDAQWCQVEVSGFKGWMIRKSIWGVYEGEQIN